MKRRDPAEVTAWLGKVSEDLRAVRVLRRHAPTLDAAICFHCQQAAEKLLKALHVVIGRDPPRTHHLPALAAGIRDAFPDIDALADELSFLTEFAVISRYPGPPEPGSTRRAKVERAAACARRVDRAVRGILRSRRGS